jgi:hypothetical protein
MKFALIAGACALALAACSASQIQTASSNVSAVNSAVVSGLGTVAQSIVAACPTGQAFLSAAAAATANPDVVIAQDANGLFCAANKAVVAVAPAAASAPVAASISK